MPGRGEFASWVRWDVARAEELATEPATLPGHNTPRAPRHMCRGHGAGSGATGVGGADVCGACDLRVCGGTRPRMPHDACDLLGLGQSVRGGTMGDTDESLWRGSSAW